MWCVSVWFVLHWAAATKANDFHHHQQFQHTAPRQRAAKTLNDFMTEKINGTEKSSLNLTVDIILLVMWRIAHFDLKQTFNSPLIFHRFRQSARVTPPRRGGEGEILWGGKESRVHYWGLPNIYPLHDSHQSTHKHTHAHKMWSFQMLYWFTEWAVNQAVMTLEANTVGHQTCDILRQKSSVPTWTVCEQKYKHSGF